MNGQPDQDCYPETPPIEIGNGFPGKVAHSPDSKTTFEGFKSTLSIVSQEKDLLANRERQKRRGVCSNPLLAQVEADSPAVHFIQTFQTLLPARGISSCCKRVVCPVEHVSTIRGNRHPGP